MQAEKVETFQSEFKKMRHGCHKRTSISPSKDGRICKYRRGHCQRRSESPPTDESGARCHSHHGPNRFGPRGHHFGKHHGHGHKGHHHHHGHEHGEHHPHHHHHGPRFGWLRRFHRRSPSCEHREESTSFRGCQRRERPEHHQEQPTMRGHHNRCHSSFFGMRRRHSFGGFRGRENSTPINIE